jgi:hypothetical protein
MTFRRESATPGRLPQADFMLWPILTNLFAPRFDWIQVEVTTHCQAACSYCPHTVYQEHWASQHLSLATFRRLLPGLKRARLVHLQGWGEPFWNPDFFTMVSLARQAGCQVGTTTNAMLLEADSLRRLVDLEMAVVAFSLAGVGENNDAVRRGTRFATVLDKIETLNEIKARKGALLPKIHVAYMLLRSGLTDLALLPQALAGLGISQVVVSTLEFVAQPSLARESLRLPGGRGQAGRTGEPGPASRSGSPRPAGPVRLPAQFLFGEHRPCPVRVCRRCHLPLCLPQSAR